MFSRLFPRLPDCGFLGHIEAAVLGRAIQERFESDSRAIRSDSVNLNEKGMIFVWVLARGQSDSSVPSYPLYNIKRGDGMKWGGQAHVEAFTMSKGGSRILPPLSPEEKRGGGCSAI